MPRSRSRSRLTKELGALAAALAVAAGLGCRGELTGPPPLQALRGPLAPFVWDLAGDGWRVRQCHQTSETPSMHGVFPGRPPFTMCFEASVERDAAVELIYDADRVVQRLVHTWRLTGVPAEPHFLEYGSALTERFGTGQRCSVGFRMEWVRPGVPDHLVILAAGQGAFASSYALTVAHESPICGEGPPTP